MSTALAIASVTAVLKDLLNNGVIDHDVTGVIGGNVIVTALPPDRIETTGPNAQSQLNLFLYQVTPNQGWRNVGLPSRNGQGERLTNPPLALDLHYLLTAYGINELHSEILLGYGMQWLHETPVLPRDAIRLSLAPPLPKALSTSQLADQVEQIKISPHAMSTEEVYRLWSAFQAKYRPSTAYLVSVVLIESRRPTKSALPVRARNVYLIPSQQPIIEQIKSQAKAGDPVVADQPILAGYNLVIAGKQLRSEDTMVNLGGIEVPPTDQDASGTQIIVPIPANVRAGVQGVQVIHRKLMGTPPMPHRGFESNVAAFVLRPRIETINVSNVQGAGTNPRSANVNLTVKPAIGNTQRVVLLMNEFVPVMSPPGSEVMAQSYSFPVPPRAQLSSPPGPPGASESIAVPIRGVKAGTYLVRVQVDGAESLLGTDAAGQYNAPRVTIP